MPDDREDALRALSEALAGEGDGGWGAVARKFSELSRLPGLSGLAEGSRTLPEGFAAGFSRAMRLVDEAVRCYGGRLRRAGFQVSCRGGCAWCCRQMPAGAGPAEVVFLYHGLCETGGLSRTFRRSIGAAEVLDRMSCEPGGEGRGLLALYQARGGVCPVLDGSLCGAYPFRPLACRVHLSLSRPRYCNPESPGFPGAVVFNLEPPESVREALGALDARLGIEVSGLLACGLGELAVNVMGFENIRWTGSGRRGGA